MICKLEDCENTVDSLALCSKHYQRFKKYGRTDIVMPTGFRHGWVGSPEHRTWTNMKQRCLNKSNPGYKDYGARGITVCTKWMSFKGFIADMGQKPSNSHSLDRIDVNGNYEPSNCRWATPKVQANNARSNVQITYMGVTKNIKQWSEATGLNVNSLYYRLSRIKMSPEDVLSKRDWRASVKQGASHD